MSYFNKQKLIEFTRSFDPAGVGSGDGGSGIPQLGKKEKKGKAPRVEMGTLSHEDMSSLIPSKEGNLVHNAHYHILDKPLAPISEVKTPNTHLRHSRAQGLTYVAPSIEGSLHSDGHFVHGPSNSHQVAGTKIGGLGVNPQGGQSHAKAAHQAVSDALGVGGSDASRRKDFMKIFHGVGDVDKAMTDFVNKHGTRRPGHVKNPRRFEHTESLKGVDRNRKNRYEDHHVEAMDKAVEELKKFHFESLETGSTHPERIAHVRKLLSEIHGTYPHLDELRRKIGEINSEIEAVGDPEDADAIRKAKNKQAEAGRLRGRMLDMQRDMIQKYHGIKDLVAHGHPQVAVVRSKKGDGTDYKHQVFAITNSHNGKTAIIHHNGKQVIRVDSGVDHGLNGSRAQIPHNLKPEDAAAHSTGSLKEFYQKEKNKDGRIDYFPAVLSRTESFGGYSGDAIKQHVVDAIAKAHAGDHVHLMNLMRASLNHKAPGFSRTLDGTDGTNHGSIVGGRRVDFLPNDEVGNALSEKDAQHLRELSEAHPHFSKTELALHLMNTGGFEGFKRIQELKKKIASGKTSPEDVQKYRKEMAQLGSRKQIDWRKNTNARGAMEWMIGHMHPKLANNPVFRTLRDVYHYAMHNRPEEHEVNPLADHQSRLERTIKEYDDARRKHNTLVRIQASGKLTKQHVDTLAELAGEGGPADATVRYSHELDQKAAEIGEMMHRLHDAAIGVYPQNPDFIKNQLPTIMGNVHTALKRNTGVITRLKQHGFDIPTPTTIRRTIEKLPDPKSPEVQQAVAEMRKETQTKADLAIHNNRKAMAHRLWSLLPNSHKDGLSSKVAQFYGEHIKDYHDALGRLVHKHIQHGHLAPLNAVLDDNVSQAALEHVLTGDGPHTEAIDNLASKYGFANSPHDKQRLSNTLSKYPRTEVGRSDEELKGILSDMMVDKMGHQIGSANDVPSMRSAITDAHDKMKRALDNVSGGSTNLYEPLQKMMDYVDALPEGDNAGAAARGGLMKIFNSHRSSIRREVNKALRQGLGRINTPHSNDTEGFKQAILERNANFHKLQGVTRQLMDGDGYIGNLVTAMPFVNLALRHRKWEVGDALSGSLFRVAHGLTKPGISAAENGGVDHYRARAINDAMGYGGARNIRHAIHALTENPSSHMDTEIDTLMHLMPTRGGASAHMGLLHLLNSITGSGILSYHHSDNDAIKALEGDDKSVLYPPPVMRDEESIQGLNKFSGKWRGFSPEHKSLFEHFDNMPGTLTEDHMRDAIQKLANDSRGFHDSGLGQTVREMAEGALADPSQLASAFGNIPLTMGQHLGINSVHPSARRIEQANLTLKHLGSLMQKFGPDTTTEDKINAAHDYISSYFPHSNGWHQLLSKALTLPRQAAVERRVGGVVHGDEHQYDIPNTLTSHMDVLHTIKDMATEHAQELDNILPGKREALMSIIGDPHQNAQDKVEQVQRFLMDNAPHFGSAAPVGDDIHSKLEHVQSYPFDSHDTAESNLNRLLGDERLRRKHRGDTSKKSAFLHAFRSLDPTLGHYADAYKGAARHLWNTVKRDTAETNFSDREHSGHVYGASSMPSFKHVTHPSYNATASQVDDLKAWLQPERSIREMQKKGGLGADPIAGVKINAERGAAAKKIMEAARHITNNDTGENLHSELRRALGSVRAKDLGPEALSVIHDHLYDPKKGLLGYSVKNLHNTLATMLGTSMGADEFENLPADEALGKMDSLLGEVKKKLGNDESSQSILDGIRHLDHPVLNKMMHQARVLDTSVPEQMARHYMAVLEDMFGLVSGHTNTAHAMARRGEALHEARRIAEKQRNYRARGQRTEGNPQRSALDAMTGDNNE